MQEDDKAFQFLLEKLYRNRGVDFSLYRSATLKRRLHTRLRATNCANYMEYVLCLNRDPGEYDRLLQALTINVTEFFRDPEIFEILEKKIIPKMLKRKKAKHQRIVRVWSAGCSQGEEVYSLAILFSKYTKDFMIKIYGSDIDEECIARAKRGFYGSESLRNVGKEILNNFFSQAGEKVKISPELKAITRFKKHDLILEEYPNRMDLILCRNVLIYFSRDLQDQVVSHFSRVLNRNGFLILGKVESLPASLKSVFESLDNRERIYQKR